MLGEIDLRILVIDASQRPSVKEELVQSSSVHPVRIGSYSRLFSQNNFPRDCWVNRQHTPVHESSIS